MKSKIILLLLTLIACTSTPTPMTIPENAEAALLSLRSEAKYVEDMQIIYPGIMDEELRPVLTVHVDKAIEDMLSIVRSGQATKEAYLKAIKQGLKRFDGQYLDTEDRERTALYFQEMMDIVGLESSDGMLNAFIYL